MANHTSNPYQEALNRIRTCKKLGRKNLNLSDLEITKVPGEIQSIESLKILNLSRTAITNIPGHVFRCRELRDLVLTNTRIERLPPEIIKLRELKRLNIDNTPIVELPTELHQLPKLQTLHVQSCPHLKLPPEIASKTDSALILQYYFENVVGSKRPLNEIKMILLGEGGVGKTAIVNKLVNNKFEDTEKTEGIDIHRWNVEIDKEKRIQINIWDFAGQEITHATHQFFLTHRSLYLLILNSRGDEKSNRLEEWLKLIKNLSGESPVIIVCNKTDQHKMTLDNRALLDKYRNICQIIDVSCKEDTNIENLRQSIFDQIKSMPHVFDPFSEKWFEVKTSLENLEENYIPFEDYEKLCDKAGISNHLDRDTLIRFLHDLGVVLNFSDDRRLNDTNVLKPEWITVGVYKILNSNLLEHNPGILNLYDLDKILDKHIYPKHKHRFILQMLEKFERCLPLDPETFLVPDRLPKQEPDFEDWHPKNAGLGFHYHYEIEPNSFITRFIVNMRPYIHENKYWRKGVVLSNSDENLAIVKVDSEDKKIFVWIDGKKSMRRGFLSMIRRQFEKIHKTIPNLKVEEFVQHEKGLIAYTSLLKLEARGITKHYLPEIDSEIDVGDLLSGIETKGYSVNRRAHRDGIFQNDIENDIFNLYDVAFTFAGEDREFVRQVYDYLDGQNFSVFYDLDEEVAVDLWGKDLIEELDDIYRNRSKCVVMFVSQSYYEKVWTKLERRSALAKALNENREYVLPARFDETDLPGLLPTVAFVDLRNETPQSFAQKVIRKLEKSR